MGLLKTLIACSCCVFSTHVAQAEPNSPDIRHELSLFGIREDALDPIGLDQSVGQGLDEAAARLPREKPEPAPPPVRIGHVLTAIEPVHERAHDLALRWADGLVFADVRIALVSDSARAAAVSYRLPLPAGAIPIRVRVCLKEACTMAAPSPPDGLPESKIGPAKLDHTPGEMPGVHAVPIVDERGPALSLSAFPVSKDAPLTVELAYVAEAPVRGGVVHIAIPERGEDPRIVPMHLTLSAPASLSFDFTDAIVDDSIRGLALRGALAPGARIAHVERQTCASRMCMRRYQASAYEAAPLRETWLWIDASPSMEGMARNRADRVLATLLSVLPEATQLRATAFAARGRAVGQWSVADVRLAALSDALSEDLGASSRPQSALLGSERELRALRPRLLVLSDGLFDAGADSMRALRAAAMQGAEVWLLHVGDQPWLAPAAVRVIPLSALADSRADGAENALSDALRVLSSRATAFGFAGEEQVLEASSTSAVDLKANTPWLAFWLARKAGPQSFHGSGTLSHSTEAQLVLAPTYAAKAPATAPEITSLPKETVLSMLRSQLVPKARACLRNDRRGRTSYAVKLSFEAEFAHREVSNTRVVGAVPEPLAQCLLALLPALRIPAFNGRIRVRYPIYTEREEEPQVTALDDDVADRVERALHTRPGQHRPTGRPQ